MALRFGENQGVNMLE